MHVNQVIFYLYVAQSVYHRDHDTASGGRVVFDNDNQPTASSQLPLGALCQPHGTNAWLPRSVPPSSSHGARDKVSGVCTLS